ncbi:MAG: MogA/MoaB family molybdenum cofactor biosynthesis protein [Candidatus Aminicenantales bacterium]|jgi:molybdenum cofactor biosynthesis protein B
MLAIAVITVSDRAYKKEYEDVSGPLIRDILFAGLGAEVTITVVPDEKEALQKAIRGNAGKDYVITTGGTGLSPRDITPEATKELCDKDVPGISEWLRRESIKETPNAVLSRGYSGLMGRTIVINLPGSVKGAAFGAKLLVPILEHGADMVRGGKH